MVKGAHKYQIRRVSIPIKNLPPSFEGLKIIHISDIHSGSFYNKEAVLKGINMVIDEKPDLVFFTGDLVNNEASEIVDYMDVFSKITAPLGVFSVLGNHDYGDYIPWSSPEAKVKNLKTLMQHHADMGWKLLMDEHTEISRNGESITILGIQNWGAKGRFPKYGDLAKAAQGTENHKVKLLLSHDPSHWDAQVLKDFPDIDAMFSGHTHGMQFGIDIPGLKWSPIQYMYKQWAGLYSEGHQHLHVNRGFGFLGYPGRVGIWPEISVISLEGAGTKA
jgi:predicted MPP superfamily phosphohydrolase